MKGSWTVGQLVVAILWRSASEFRKSKELVTDLAMTMKIIKHEFRVTNILEFSSYLTQNKN